MGWEHRDPLAILLDREKKELRSQDVKISLKKDGLEVHIKLFTSDCIDLASRIEDEGTLWAKLRIIADHLESKKGDKKGD